MLPSVNLMLGEENVQVFLTVSDLLHNEGVKADLIDALLQAVGLVDLLHLLVKHHLLRVGQLGTQNPVVEFLWGGQRQGDAEVVANAVKPFDS